ncbi:MAG: GTP-binding protein [Eubacterium sp.]|nr:GTP-binding protein [Eubacterium sp.]
MRKVDLITGFLGSGKTTFLKRYADYLIRSGGNIGIIENDHGAVNVDMLLLQELLGTNCDLEMVTGNCDLETHMRRLKTKLISFGMRGAGRVLVEPSGIFDVDEFFDVLREEPLDRWYEIGSVIAIVDAKLEDDLSEQSNYMLASQIANAGKVIISRSQESTRDDLRHTIRHLNEVMEMFGCKRRFFCSELGLGPNSSEISDKGDSLPDPRSDVLKKNWDDLTDDDFAAIASCGYILEDHVKLPFDRENDYDSVYIFKARTTKEDLTGRIRDLFTDSSLGNIFRIKGFMPLEDGSWIELNATHRAIEVKPIERGQEIFIVIGEGLDKNKIAARWADIMGEM